MTISDTSRLPPTPAPSNDISPHPGYRRQSLDSSFTLGPAALNHSSPSAASPGFQNGGLTGSPLNHQRTLLLPSPISPSAVGGADFELQRNRSRPKDSSTDRLPALQTGVALKPAPRGRTRAAQAPGKPKVVLKKPPPPPANIIKRYNPRATKKSSSPVSPQPTAPASRKRKAKDGSDNESKAPSPKKKVTQRRTAHSEIERNRRVKINSANDHLKALIPACRDREQTKLNILEQAAKYIEYLEETIETLKGAVDVSYNGAEKSNSPPKIRLRNFKRVPKKEPSPEVIDVDMDDDDSEGSDGSGSGVEDELLHTEDGIQDMEANLTEHTLPRSMELPKYQQKPDGPQHPTLSEHPAHQTARLKALIAMGKQQEAAPKEEETVDGDASAMPQPRSPLCFSRPQYVLGVAGTSPTFGYFSLAPLPEVEKQETRKESLPSIIEALDFSHTCESQRSEEDAGDQQASEALLQLASSDRKPMSVADMLNKRG